MPDRETGLHSRIKDEGTVERDAARLSRPTNTNTTSDPRTYQAIPSQSIPTNIERKGTVGDGAFPGEYGHGRCGQINASQHECSSEHPHISALLSQSIPAAKDTPKEIVEDIVVTDCHRRKVPLLSQCQSTNNNAHTLARQCTTYERYSQSSNPTYDSDLSNAILCTLLCSTQTRSHHISTHYHQHQSSDFLPLNTIKHPSFLHHDRVTHMTHLNAVSGRQIHPLSTLNPQIPSQHPK